MESEQRFITVKEAAELFRVDTETIYRWLNNKVIPGFKVGGAWRIERSALDILWKSGVK